MKSKKKLIIIIACIVAIIALAITTFLILQDENKLTINERNWINSNINTVQNINVVNNVNIFGTTGAGVFFDFINDFAKNYNLEIPCALEYNFPLDAIGDYESGLGHTIEPLNILDENGYINVDNEYRTKINGIYAAGNAANYLGKVKTLASGFGDVVNAITAIHQQLYPTKNPTFFSSLTKK